MAEPSRLAQALEYFGGLDAAVAPKLRAVSDAIDPVSVARRAGLNLPTGEQVGMAAHFVGPGADIEGMVNDAREGNAAVGRGDLLGAFGGYGSAAAALPMMFLPGTVAGVKKGVGAAADGIMSRHTLGSVNDVRRGGASPVYHDSSADGVLGIFGSGKIEPRTPWDSPIPSVSVTRDFANFSRRSDAPYRFVVDSGAVPHKSSPVDVLRDGSRAEAEERFSKPVPLNSVSGIVIDVSNPIAALDLQSGKLKSLVDAAKEKGVKVEFYDSGYRSVLNPSKNENSVAQFREKFDQNSLAYGQGGE
jgi:hypothetical protein